jgi:hypothetical protein
MERVDVPRADDVLGRVGARATNVEAVLQPVDLRAGDPSGARGSADPMYWTRDDSRHQEGAGEDECTGSHHGPHRASP